MTKSRKKWLSLLVVTTLCFGNGTMVFAEDPSNEGQMVVQESELPEEGVVDTVLPEGSNQGENQTEKVPENGDPQGEITENENSGNQTPEEENLDSQIQEGEKPEGEDLNSQAPEGENSGDQIPEDEKPEDGLTDGEIQGENNSTEQKKILLRKVNPKKIK